MPLSLDVCDSPVVLRRGWYCEELQECIVEVEVTNHTPHAKSQTHMRVLTPSEAYHQRILPGPPQRPAWIYTNRATQSSSGH